MLPVNNLIVDLSKYTKIHSHVFDLSFRTGQIVPKHCISTIIRRYGTKSCDSVPRKYTNLEPYDPTATLSSRQAEKEIPKMIQLWLLAASLINKEIPQEFAHSLDRLSQYVREEKQLGPLYQKTDQLKADHLPPVQRNFYKKPLLIHQGQMQWLYDHEGRKYLDLFGGIVTVSVGHCHPKVVAAMEEQIKKLWHTTTIYRNPKIYEYVEKLVSKMPGDLKVVYLVNSGTEANDLAVLLAKLYTGNHDVISLQNSYHGCSTAMLGLTSTQSYMLPTPMPPGYSHAMLPDPMRGLWGGCRDSLSQVKGSCSCPGDCVTSDKYIHQLNEHLLNTMPAGKAAAMFAESIQGVNGTVQFPKGYIKKAQQLIREHNGVFVSDEVQTGFGRTGDAFWGFENHGIIPDIVTMAKGIGNGFPMAAVVTTKEIASAHNKAAYFNTFGGNPMACAAGKAVLEVIEEEKLQENCKVTGKYFIEQLMQLQKHYPVIGDVRGKGLMLGIELVIPGTKDPLKASDIADIFEKTKDLGVLLGCGGRYSNVLRIKPPMCITKQDVDYAVSVLDKTFKEFMNKTKSH